MTDPSPPISDRTLEALLAERAWVQRLARSLVADIHRADDIAQTAWTTAIQRPPAHVRNVRSWLATLVRNTARTMARGDARRERRERERQRELELDLRRKQVNEQPVRSLERAELVRELVNVVLGLREPYRSALVLAYFEGLDPSAIAERLRLPSATVRSHIKRGLELVRGELGHEHRDDDERGREAWISALMSIATEQSRGGRALQRNPWARAGTTAGTLLIAMKTKLILAALIVLALGYFVWSQHRPEVRLHDEIAEPAAEKKHLESSPTLAAPESSAREVLTASSTPIASPAAAIDASLRIEVVWAKDGSPAAGVGVLVRARDAALRSIEREGVTGPDGSLVYEHMDPGAVAVYVDRGGAEKTAIEPGKLARARVAIEPGVHVRGIVVDPELKPVDGASIGLSYELGNGRNHVVARSSSDGTFEIDSVSARHYVGARKAGWAPSYAQELAGRVGETVDVRLVLLGPGGAVDGLVLGPDSKPIANADVRFGVLNPQPVSLPDHQRGAAAVARHCSTDQDGRFSADDVALGTNEIEVGASGFARQTLSFDVGADAPARIVVHLGIGAVFTGIVQDAEGEPIAGASVGFLGSKVEVGTRVKTDDHGAFRIERVPAGTHRVLADADVRGRLRATIDAHDGEESVWNATVDRGITLSGRTVDELDQPLSGMRVFLHPATEKFSDAQWVAMADWSFNWGITTTDADGRFMLCNLLEGESSLEVRRVRQGDQIPVVEIVDVRPRMKDVLIRIRSDDAPSAFAHGVVTDESGQPIGDASVRLLKMPAWMSGASSGSTSDRETGAFKIGPVPAGSYLLTVQARGFGEPILAPREFEKGADIDFGNVRLQSAGGVCVHLKRVGGGAIGNLTLIVAGKDLFHETLVPFGDRARSGSLAPGSYRLVVSGEDGVRAGAEVFFDVASGKQTDLEFELPRAIH